MPDRTKYGRRQRFLWYGPALVRAPGTRSAARLAASAALVLAGVSAASAAGPRDALQGQVRAIDARAHRALLDLYALDTRLHTARARLAALEAQATHLRLEQGVLVQRLSATRNTLVVSQHKLADNLSMLYKQGDVSTLAVVLGSSSLDDAVSKIDDLNRVADESRQVVQITAGAQARVVHLQATLRARSRALGAAVRDARATAAALESARAERIAFIAGLRREQRLRLAQIQTLQAAARRVERKSNEIQAAAAPPAASLAVPAPPPAAGGRTIVVSSTGYALAGRTATGMPTGPGVVAVDPAVIPLGTRLSIPGYGEGVAADTGGSVRGNTIDLWFPTLAQARAWGRRTITITLH